MAEIVTLLTARELAKRFGCSERKLERHRLVGDGPPFVKIGGLIRYPLDELERWVADNTRRSTSQIAPTGFSPPRKARKKLEFNDQK